MSPRRNKKDTIPFEELDHLYNAEKKSARFIASIYSFTEGTVRARMRDLGMQCRGQDECHNRYEKYDFDGTDAEKAYLLGFRIGDLNVYTKTPLSKTVVVRSSTTHEAQADLFHSLFSKYGHVSIHAGKQCIQMHAYLNRSFAFLIPKDPIVPEWIRAKFQNSLAFTAGYIDAEGSFGVYEGKARFKLDSYDQEILSWIHEYFQRRGVLSKFWRISQAGDPQGGGMCYNKDLWRLNINESYSLLYFLRLIKFMFRHAHRRRDAQTCEDNIWDRMKRGSIQRYHHAQ